MLWIVDNSFRFTFYLLFLPSYSPELLPAIPDSISTPDPSPVPVAVYPPRYTLKLRPFLQVFLDSCHLFPRNHRLSWTAVTFFPQKPPQLHKI